MDNRTLGQVMPNTTLAWTGSNTTEGRLVIEDAVYPNGSEITTNWSEITLGCSEWKLPNHYIFQAANALLFVGLLAPKWKHGVLFLHFMFVLGFLLMSVWAWMILCSPDYFSWNFAFVIINIIQTLVLLYHIKPVTFDCSLENLYTTVFQPMNVSRHLFKKLTHENYCMMSYLHDGDAYAVQGVTKTDRLGMLVSGTMKVCSHQNTLHLIRETEFIDSPEFESSVTGEEKFQVSICAMGGMCKYIYWPRQSLEYLLLKEPFLAYVLNTIMGRDITNKLYALNTRAKEPENHAVASSNHVSSPAVTRETSQLGDLRRTLAQVSGSNPLTGRQPVLTNMSNLLLEESEELDGPYSAFEEEIGLLQVDGQRCDSPARSSLHSCQSGLQFDVKH